MGTQVGQCPRCGAPLYAESPWWGVTLPPVIRTCGCFPQTGVVTTNQTNSPYPVATGE